MEDKMRKVKAQSVLALTKAYAEECVASGLYTANPAKPEWRAIVAKVTADGGMLRIPWAFQQGDMREQWGRSYDAAKRRLAKGGKLVKAAPKPKARKRTPKAGTTAPKAGTTSFAGIEWTDEQVAMLTALLAGK